MKKIDNGKQRYIKINKELIPVTEEVYLFHSRWKENERYRARRDGKCGMTDFRKCTGDCLSCPWYQEGFNMLSYDKAFGSPDSEEDLHPVCNIPDPSEASIESLIADRDLLARLMKRLDEIVPDGGQICRMISEEYSDREMTRELNLKRQSTLSYRKKKVVEFLREHWFEYFD